MNKFIEYIPAMYGVVGLSFICIWVMTMTTGCDSMARDYKWTSGEKIAYCIVEDTPPSRTLCVNSVLMKENPLFGTKQGEFPYTKASYGDWSLSCYCNPELVTIEENRQQGTISKFDK